MTETQVRFVEGKFVTGHISRKGAFVDVRDCPTRACFETHTLWVDIPRGVESLKGFGVSILSVESEAEVNSFWIGATALKVEFEVHQVVVTPGTDTVWHLRRTAKSLQDEADRKAAWEKRETAEPLERERAIAVVGQIVTNASNHHKKDLRRWALSGGWKKGGIQEIEIWLTEEVKNQANITFLNASSFIHQQHFIDAVKKAL